MKLDLEKFYLVKHQVPQFTLRTKPYPDRLAAFTDQDPNQLVLKGVEIVSLLKLPNTFELVIEGDPTGELKENLLKQISAIGSHVPVEARQKGFGQVVTDNMEKGGLLYEDNSDSN